MKKTNIYTAIISLIMAVTLSSCGSSQAAGSTSSKTAEGTVKNGTTEIKSVENENGETIEVISTSFDENTSGALDTSEAFSERDLEQTADTSEATALEIANGKTVSISDGGTYIVSGTAKNCTIRIEADKKEKVQLILDGVNITNDDFPAIYVVSADKCFITTSEGSENSLEVTGSFTADGDTNTDAVIFSKDDLVFNGMGTLTVTSAQGNGITGKDDIKFTGGTYTMTTAGHSIEAKDSISICGGTYNITSTDKDGLHCDNSDDDSKGNILIAGGTFTINAASDGIRATTIAQFDGGTVDITSSEGIEATYVQINDGTITVTATDDGINAAQKSNSVGTPTFEMNGGSLTVTVSGGDVDGIDANGNITVAGGTLDITYPGRAPSEAMDYDGTASYTGGTIIINGEQVDSIPESMMGGMGGPGGMGKFDGNFPSDFDGKTPPDFDGDFPSDFDGKKPGNGFKGGKQSTDTDDV